MGQSYEQFQRQKNYVGVQVSFVHGCLLLRNFSLGGGGYFFSLQNYAIKDSMYVNLCRCFFYRMELNNLFVIRTLQETDAQKVNFGIQKQRCYAIATA